MDRLADERAQADGAPALVPNVDVVVGEKIVRVGHVPGEGEPDDVALGVRDAVAVLGGKPGFFTDEFALVIERLHGQDLSPAGSKGPQLATARRIQETLGPSRPNRRGGFAV